MDVPLPRAPKEFMFPPCDDISLMESVLFTRGIEILYEPGVDGTTGGSFLAAAAAFSAASAAAAGTPLHTSTK